MLSNATNLIPMKTVKANRSAAMTVVGLQIRINAIAQVVKPIKTEGRAITGKLIGRVRRPMSRSPWISLKSATWYVVENIPAQRTTARNAVELRCSRFFAGMRYVFVNCFHNNIERERRLTRY